MVHDSSRGLFITFEGADASGKTTQARLAAHYLNAMITREPGGTPLGVKVREMCLGMEFDPSPETELILMAADRAEHVNKVLLPTLLSGRNVVCDRYTNSTIAYQGAGRLINMDVLLEVTKIATCGLVPDLVVVIDVAASTAKARQVTRGHADRMDQTGDDFQARVRQSYLDQASKDESMIVVDGNGSITEVADLVFNELKKYFKDAVTISR